MPVQGKLSLSKKGRLDFDRRGVDRFRRENIPDIGGMEKDLAGVKGLVGTLVHIGQRAVTNSENVDLQRVDCLKSVMPPFLLKGGFALRLLPGLLQIDVQVGPVDQKIPCQPSFDERCPVNACVETLDAGDRRVRNLILDEDEVIQVQGQADRMEIGFLFLLARAFFGWLAAADAYPVLDLLAAGLAWTTPTGLAHGNLLHSRVKAGLRSEHGHPSRDNPDAVLASEFIRDSART